jgi:pimeloyl-ACP methyl ester carboxylesterase
MVLIAAPPLSNPIDPSVFNPHPAAGLLFKQNLTERDIDEYASALVHPGASLGAEFKEDLRRADPLTRKYIYQAISSGNMKDEVRIAENCAFPLALIQGESDQLINSEYYSNLKIPKLWKGRVHYIEQAGHSPQFEQPEAINKLLTELIEDIHY